MSEDTRPRGGKKVLRSQREKGRRERGNQRIKGTWGQIGWKEGGGRGESRNLFSPKAQIVAFRAEQALKLKRGRHPSLETLRWNW